MGNDTDAPLPHAHRFCEECGASLGDGAKFCPACGSPASDATPPTDSPDVVAPESDKTARRARVRLSRRVLIVGLGIVLVVAVAAGLVIGLSGGGSSGPSAHQLAVQQQALLASTELDTAWPMYVATENALFAQQSTAAGSNDLQAARSAAQLRANAANQLLTRLATLSFPPSTKRDVRAFLSAANNFVGVLETAVTDPTTLISCRISYRITASRSAGVVDPAAGVVHTSGPEFRGSGRFQVRRCDNVRDSRPQPPTPTDLRLRLETQGE